MHTLQPCAHRGVLKRRHELRLDLLEQVSRLLSLRRFNEHNLNDEIKLAQRSGRLLGLHHMLFEQKSDVIHQDRKSTRLNSSHVKISYAVFCLKKKNELLEAEDVLC